MILTAMLDKMTSAASSAPASPRLVSVFSSATLLCFAVGLSPASAGAGNCSAYGSGYDGSETCIHAGEHVRVDIDASGPDRSNGWTSAGARPASLRSGSDDAGNAIGDFGPSHLRLRPGVLGSGLGYAGR